ncbi:amino acid permease [Desulfatitalea alkaliphila]|uniref:Amino acid permease n=1 Tax=Desulfatitalea alkaliphila TaxID=2929485 RepID=A0AA41R671_9BACT|nr:amino acid permease [Desulfatitalea alkaliphila]MCJ8501850.1 amino acid permease [Desulfatitalea alkaliphila]
MSIPDVEQEQKPPTKFGAFGGVFTPSVLTILGVIMFLRYADVVGYAGLWAALSILLLAKSITIVTSLSLSSIATNMRVRGGGAYYLISRSLGVEFGGVIAIFFYVAQAVAVTMYVIGFTESVFAALPVSGLSFTTVATLTNLFVLVCVYIGAGWTIRLQYGILAVVLLAVASFSLGAWDQASMVRLQENLTPQWTDTYSFFTTFALFFPAVTGIMAGVNMSGDLKDPSRAIPLGTFGAITFTGLIYGAMAFLLAAGNTRATLIGEGFVMYETARFGPLVTIGVMAATLSSALGSMMGAPRILQAFARDNVFKQLRFFAPGSGVSGEPRRAIVLTFVIAQVALMAGDLDSVAPIITMFFLMTYGTVNLACFYESISRNPSFRPTFRLNHWTLSLAGALSCVAVMLLINTLWAVVAMALAGGMYLLIARAELMVQWGDVESGVAFQRARKSLLRLERERYHPKNWRPSILALSGMGGRRLHMLKYACLLSADRGVVSLAQIIVGDLENLSKRRFEAEKILRKYLREEDLAAFPVAIVDESFTEALKALLQCHGIGGLRPNTLLLGWSDDPEKARSISEALGMARALRRSCLLVHSRREAQQWDLPRGAINIWWTDAVNGPMMLLLGFLLKENREWRDCPLRILRPVAPKADVGNVAAEMREVLSLARIEGEVVVLPTEDPLQAVHQHMGSSAVLFAGFAPVPDENPACVLLSGLQETMDLPGDVILVHNAGDVSLDA